jgi:hypothetical protein
MARFAVVWQQAGEKDTVAQLAAVAADRSDLIGHVRM